MRNLTLFLLLLLLVTSWSHGCVEQKEAKQKVIDQLGREVFLPDRIGRLASLWPESTATLYALGLGDKIVGVDSYSNTSPVLTRAFPQVKEITDVGNVFAGTLSIEKIAQLKPDIVFMSTDHPDVADRIQKSLGIPVVCVRMHPPPERKISFDLVTIIGKCTGKEKRGEELKNHFERKLLEITSVTSKIPDSKKPKVYQAFAFDLLRAAGYFDTIELGGGKSVTGGTTQAWVTVSLEDVLQWNPDVIILHGLGKFTPEDVLTDPRWQPIKAVKERKVHRLFLGWMGLDPPVFVINVMQYARVFHPEKFNFDIEKEANELLKEFYGIDGLYRKLKSDYRLSDI